MERKVKNANGKLFLTEMLVFFFKEPTETLMAGVIQTMQNFQVKNYLEKVKFVDINGKIKLVIATTHRKKNTVLNTCNGLTVIVSPFYVEQVDEIPVDEKL